MPRDAAPEAPQLHKRPILLSLERNQLKVAGDVSDAVSPGIVVVPSSIREHLQ